MRWRLVDRDTIAEVPYATILDWATYRTVDRQMRRNAAVRLVTAEGLVRSQKHEIDILHTAMQAQATDIAALRTALTDTRLAGSKCCSRADRLKAWATVGKVGAGIAAAGLAGAAYIAIAR